MSKESFGSNVGDGIGCFLVLVGLGILLFFPAVLDLIGKFAK